MNIKFTPEERTAFLKEMVTDEITHMVRDEFRKQYQYIIQEEAQKKIDRVIEENKHIFLDSFKRITEDYIKKSYMNTFADGSKTGGYSVYWNHKYIFNEETQEKLRDKMFEEIKKEFDMEEFNTEIREQVIKKLTK